MNGKELALDIVLQLREPEILTHDCTEDQKSVEKIKAYQLKIYEWLYIKIPYILRSFFQLKKG